MKGEIYIIKLLKKKKEQTLNEFLNIKDIKKSYLYTLDEQVVLFIKVEPMNIELLSDEELEIKMDSDSIEFSGEQFPYKIIVIPRAIDISEHIQENEIYNMDCAEGIKLLNDKSIDLVVMDPPYLLNLTKVKKTSPLNNYANDLLGLKDGFDLKVLDLLVPKMKKINMYIYCSKRQVKELIDYFVNKNCNYEILTWHKQNPNPLTNNIYLPDTEYIIFAREKGVKLYGNYHTKRKYYISGTNQMRL